MPELEYGHALEMPKMEALYICSSCQGIFRNDQAVLYLIPCTHKYHRECIETLLKEAPLTEYGGCKECGIVPRLVMEMSEDELKRDQEVPMFMSIICSGFFEILRDERAKTGITNDEICRAARCVEKLQWIVMHDMNPITCELLHKEIKKTRLGMVAKTAIDSIFNALDKNIFYYVHERLTKREKKVSVKKVSEHLQSIQYDEYIRAKPQADITYQFALDFVKEISQLVNDENPREPGIMEPVVVNVNEFFEDELFAEGVAPVVVEPPVELVPVEPEPVDPRYALRYKIQALRDKRRRM